MVELDSKSDKINTFLQQLDMNIKKLNDAGFNGDVFAIKINQRKAAAAP